MRMSNELCIFFAMSIYFSNITGFNLRGKTKIRPLNVKKKKMRLC